jgi:hypothetical protein
MPFDTMPFDNMPFDNVAFEAETQATVNNSSPVSSFWKVPARHIRPIAQKLKS